MSSYSQKTVHYGIPVLGYGDRILPEVELKKWQTIENLFLACLRGESTAIFAEGNLSLEYRRDKKIYAVMREAGNGVICRGMSSGAYFNAVKPIEWGPLVPGSTYYLEVNSNVHTFGDSSAFSVSYSTMSSPSEKVALVATVDMRGDVFKIDRYPVGKNCPALLMRHIEDNEDPHGDILYQTNLNVKNLLEADTAKINELHVNSLIIGNKELRLDANRVHTIVVEETVNAGGNVFTPDIGGQRIVFVQSMTQFSEIVVLDDEASFKVVSQYEEPKMSRFLVSCVSK